MDKKGMSKEEALALIKSKREIASPNPGFQRQLEYYGRDRVNKSCIF